jgi:VWFA-related protein
LKRKLNFISILEWTIGVAVTHLVTRASISEKAGSINMHQPLWLSRRGFLSSLGALMPAVCAIGADDENVKFSTDVKVVSILATVRDKKGVIIRNLLKDDFVLEEDGRPQVVKYFSQQTDLPLTLGLLVDTSGSQRRVLGKERDASRTFIEQVLREDKDQTFLIHFDREVELLQDLTPSKKKLEDALDLMNGASQPQMQRRQGGGGGGGYPGGGGGGYPGGGQGGGGGRRGGGGTTLYDSVLLASNELMKKQPGRKALILMSDGVDNGSKVGISECIESAQRADTLVYSILFADKEAYNTGRPLGGFGGPGMGRRGGVGRGGPPAGANRPDGKKVLQRIAQETGGSFFEVSDKHPIEKVYSQIEEDLRNQYSLGYTSDSQNGAGFRRINLTTKNKNLLVQTRQGYYAK